MGNNILLKTLLKSVMPTVQKFVESGKIDTFLQELKGRYASNANMAEGECVEIILSTEANGAEYASVVVFDKEMRVKTLLAQQRLSELITTLFTQAEL